MDSLDVILKIAVDAGGRLTTEVVDSPCGSAPAQPIELPWDAESLAEEMQQLGLQIARPAHSDYEKKELDRPDAVAPETHARWKGLGNRLQAALFQGQVREKLLLAVGGQQGRSAAGRPAPLRLRLVFGRPEGVPGDSDLRRGDLNLAAAIPWEYLYEPHTNQFLSVGEHFSVVRTLEAPKHIAPLPLRSPLRILLVAGQPDGFGKHPLELEKEKREIRRSLSQLEVVEIGEPDDYGLEALQRKLRSGDFHVLHFLGHGAFDGEVGGLKLAEDVGGGRRETRLLTGPHLASLLQDESQLRLVVLNACRTGQNPRFERQNPFLSVGGALIESGVPAVVAMQFPILDTAAIDFARVFYEELKAGSTVEKAVSQWRRWAQFNFDDWANPVVFLSGESGQIFDPGYLKQTTQQGPTDREGDDVDETLHLGIRSFYQKKPEDPPAWAPELEEESDLVLSLGSAFDGRSIREPTLWNGGVLPRLYGFLREADATRRPLRLEMAAHWSIAFAAGYYFEIKAGKVISLVQRGGHGVATWSADDDSRPRGPLWLAVEPIARSTPESIGDLAVAVSASGDLSEPPKGSTDEKGPVEEYLDAEGPPVRELLHFRAYPEPDQLRLRGGEHALAMARQLVDRVGALRRIDPSAKIHIFFRGPNTLAFYLGRMARTLGTIQLYEHDFEGQKHGTYEPSILLPPDAWAAPWEEGSNAPSEEAGAG